MHARLLCHDMTTDKLLVVKFVCQPRDIFGLTKLGLVCVVVHYYSLVVAARAANLIKMKSLVHIRGYIYLLRDQQFG